MTNPTVATVKIDDKIDKRQLLEALVWPGRSYLAFLDLFVRAGTVLVICLASVVIVGWLMDITLLKSVLPGLPTMKVNTATGLIASAVALWLLHTRPPESPLLPLARALALIVTLLGVLTLAEHFFSLELGIDRLILPSTQQTTNVLHPGRMTETAAFNFVFIGLALLTLKAHRPSVAAWSHWLVVPPLFVALLAVLGYAYGVSTLSEIGKFTATALHTALSVVVLNLCILAADSAHGYARVACSNSVGGLVSRQLLPTLPFLLFALGWASLWGQMAGLYDARFGLALMVLLSITICVAAVASTAVTLHQVDITRKDAEAEIIALNAKLERRVQERTEQLTQMTAELNVANKSLEQLSLHDGLTELANRRFFDTYLADQIAIARRHKRALALILCDIDAFKAYNDHYGHQAGDDNLKQIAAALQSCCRRPADMAARYGGEEFAMILPDTGLSSATQVAEAARDAVAQLKIPHKQSPAASYVSISGGVAVLLQNIDMNVQQLIAAADQALYQAKRLGRNQIVSVQAELKQKRIRNSKK